MACFQLRRRTARGFQNDFEASRDGIKSPHVGNEAIVIETFGKDVCRSILKRISDTLRRSVSKSIDRVSGRPWPDKGFQTFNSHDVDRTIEHAGDVFFDAGIVENRDDDFRIEIDQNIDIAVGPLFITRYGAKKRGMSNAMRPQVGLALPKPVDNFITFHKFILD